MNSLREDVNPVFHTAESCLLVNAQLGDTDAQELLRYLDFGEIMPDTEKDGMTPEMREFVAHKLNPGFAAMVETRFFSATRLILESGFKHVVDLPCGFTPRGVKLADKSIRYCGMDLPAVIDRIASATESIIGRNRRISYSAVDATNPDSLEEALTDFGGPLLISTEGLLMYFTQPELDEVFRNVRTLLQKYGGEWVTLDNEMLSAQNRLMEVLIGNDPDSRKQLENIVEKMQREKAPGNAFLMDNAEKYVRDMGFDLRKVPVYQYLPETLKALDQLSQEQRGKARDTFKDMYFWIMTARPDKGEISPRGDTNFSVSARQKAEELFISVAGRLDTISAPELLSIFRQSQEKETPGRITIDMEGLCYISSAGLRVLLIMYKSLKDKNLFKMINISDEVAEILKTTGFDDYFS